jgi:hypothetical protein
MMKYPALTRVFAVVLCIFAALLLLSAADGIRNAVKDKAAAARSYSLLSSRLDEYETLETKLVEAGGSERTQKELEKLTSQYEKEKTAHQMALAAYTATKGGLKEGQKMMEQADQMMSATNIVASIESAISGLTSQLIDLEDSALNAYAQYDSASQEALPLEMAYYEAVVSASLYPDDPNLTAAVMDAYMAMQPYEIQKELAQQQIEALVKEMNTSTVEVSNSGDMLSSVGTLASAYDAMNAGKAELEKMELQILRDSVDLTLRKAELEKLETEITALEGQLSGIRADERRQISLRVSLTADDRIREAYERSGNIISAGRKEVVRREKESNRNYFLGLAENILIILAVAAAFTGLPAAYERNKSRTMLVLPVFLYAFFCIVVEFMSVILQREQHYLALFAAIFGIIQLIIILPKVKEQ